MRNNAQRVLIFAIGASALFGCDKPPDRHADSPQIVNKMGVSEISPKDAQPGTEAAYSQFIDVRTREEFATGHADRARNIPLDELSNSLYQLEKNEPVYIICQTGNRSKKAAEILNTAGFSQAITITGGIEAWKAAGLPMAPVAK